MTRRFLLGTCATLCLLLTTSVPSSGAAGRWKVTGDGTCQFDASDDGPDQCEPPGRWKDDGNGGCYFDANDSGPNQCVPGGQ